MNKKESVVRTIVEMVRVDLEERAKLGEKKYGARLTVEEPCHNDKSALQNAYEEVLDLACYLKKELMDKEGQ